VHGLYMLTDNDSILLDLLTIRGLKCLSLALYYVFADKTSST
jgi:hypothetical protein